MSAARAGTGLTSRAVAPVRSAERTSAQERFDRRVHARRRRSWKVAAALVVVALAVGGVWWVLWRSDWLLVEQVVVSGIEERWEGEVLAAAAIDTPQPMVEVDVDLATSGVEGLTVVKEAQVHRSWPSTITIEVTPRRPVLAVRQGSVFALVDDEGVVVETVGEAPAEVPVVRARGEDGATEEAYRAAWAVLSGLPDSLMAQISTATVSSADLLTFELGERTVVWGGPEDAELKLRVVEALLGAGEVYIDVSAPRTPVTRPA